MGYRSDSIAISRAMVPLSRQSFRFLSRPTPCIGSHLITPALKTENFSKKSVVLVQRDFAETTDSFAKNPGFKGRGS